MSPDPKSALFVKLQPFTKVISLHHQFQSASETLQRTLLFMSLQLSKMYFSAHIMSASETTRVNKQGNFILR